MLISAWKNLCKKLDTDIAMYAIISLISIFTFSLIYGFRVLNPTYTDWLMAGGDLTQHYLGWKAYRLSGWSFPAGMVNNLAFPNRTSIIFTDSIPLFALLFKLIGYFFSCDFQYFGLWGIICFVLQGIFSCKIVYSFTKDRIAAVIAGAIFLFTPVMIFRMFHHTSLGGQWLILLALDLIFNHSKYQKRARIYAAVAAIGILTASIHIYFVLMCGIAIMGYVLGEFLETKDYKKCCFMLIDYILPVGITVYLFGGFSSGMSAQNGGLGIYSFNLNGLINPQGWSDIIPDLPVYGDGQLEGFGYLGLGCLFLLIVAFGVLIAKKEIMKTIRSKYRIVIPLLVVFGIACLIAASPVISLGAKAVTLRFPSIIIKVWNVFRASGRIIWVAVYILMIASILIVIKRLNRKVAIGILIVSVILQIYDLHSVLSQKNTYFTEEAKYESLLATEDFWNCLAQDDKIKHIVYHTSPSNDIRYSVTAWALSNGKTVSEFYFARSIEEAIEDNKRTALATLPDDTLFIFIEKPSDEEYKLHYYEVDGLLVGYINPIGNFDEVR